MPAQTLNADAFVLAKRPAAADGWYTLLLFSAEHGLITARQRLPKKPGGSQLRLDLFDEAAVELESSNQGRSWFVREARLIARQDALGRSYAALQSASVLAALLARNPVNPESRGSVGALLRTALPAFARGPHPEIVLFKAFYCFARDEGYPVKEDWFAGLSAADQRLAADLLNRPLAEQTAPPSTVLQLQRKFEDYLRAHTAILLD
jgi:hypothetical protein